MPLEGWIQNCVLARFLYDWQTLVTGFLAVLAAAGTIWSTIRSANREISASQAQTAVAQKQINTTLRLEQRRVAREGYAFCEMLEAAMGRVLADATEARKAQPKWEDGLMTALPAEAHKCFSKTAFPELRGACVKYGSLMTAPFLELESDIEKLAFASNDRLLDRLGRVEVKAKHLREEAAAGMKRANAVLAETETEATHRSKEAPDT